MNRIFLSFLCLSLQFSIFAQSSDDIVLPGAATSIGVGQIADPNSLHGFTTSLSGGISSSPDSRSFGYDSVDITAKFKLNESEKNLGLVAILGTSNWYVPSLASLYPKDYLTEVESGETAKSINSFIAGLSYQFGNRKVQEQYWASSAERISDLHLKIFNEESVIKKKEYEKDLDDLVWNEVVKKALKGSVLQVGALFKLNSIKAESAASAFDLFLTGATPSLFDTDLVGSVHYIQSLDQTIISKLGFLGTIGVFRDLTSTPPINTIGLILGYSYLAYQEKVDAVSPSRKISPSTSRYDATLAISGLLNTRVTKAPGFGIRCSYLDNSDTTDFWQLSLLVSVEALSLGT